MKLHPKEIAITRPPGISTETIILSLMSSNTSIRLIAENNRFAKYYNSGAAKHQNRAFC